MCALWCIVVHCVEARGHSWNIYHSSFHLVFGDTVSHWEPGFANQVRSASSRDHLLPYPQCWDYRHTLLHSAFSCLILRSNSGPQACPGSLFSDWAFGSHLQLPWKPFVLMPCSKLILLSKGLFYKSCSQSCLLCLGVYTWPKGKNTFLTLGNLYRNRAWETTQMTLLGLCRFLNFCCRDA